MKGKKYESKKKNEAIEKMKAGNKLESVSEETGIPISTLHRWKDQHIKNGSTNALNIELKRLQIENQLFRNVIADQSVIIYKFQQQQRKNS